MQEIRIEIYAGANGSEGEAWAAMVLRMYLRWAARRGFRVAPGRDVKRTGAGIKAAAIEVIGHGVERACGESGIHRLVRISPSDPEKRRHTSFASVHVISTIEGHIVAHARSNEVVGWRSGAFDHQIRSYVLDPYKMAKDLRTGITREDVDSVLDGDIDDFIDGAVAAGLPHRFDPNGPIAESAAVMD